MVSQDELYFRYLNLNRLFISFFCNAVQKISLFMLRRNIFFATLH